jgi:hypothetical protein
MPNCEEFPEKIARENYDFVIWEALQRAHEMAFVDD